MYFATLIGPGDTSIADSKSTDWTNELYSLYVSCLLHDVCKAASRLQNCTAMSQTDVNRDSQLMTIEQVRKYFFARCDLRYEMTMAHLPTRSSDYLVDQRAQGVRHNSRNLIRAKPGEVAKTRAFT